MPDVISSSKVEIQYGDVEKANRAVDQLGQTTRNKLDPALTQAESKFSKINKTVGVFAGALTAIGVAKFGNDVIGAATKMDSLNRMLVNVEGSQQAANKRFAEFTRLAKEPVLDPFNLSKYYTALKSVNVESKLSIDFMKNIANAMAGVGASNQQFALAMEQVVQMAGKGKVMGDDLRAIANSFPQIRKYLVEAFGTAIPEDLAKKGLNATQVLEGLNEVMAKAPKFAGGAQAAQDNFKQSLELFEATLGKNVLPTVTKFLDKMTNMMDSFQKLDPSIQKLIGGGAVAGGGLLGISAALGLIYKGIEPVTKGLAGLASTKLAGVGISTGALSGATALGMTIPQLAVTTLVVTGAAYLGAGLLGQMAGGKPATYLPSGEYVAAKGLGVGAYSKEQQAWIQNLRDLQMGSGNFPNKTFGEMLGGLKGRELVDTSSGVEFIFKQFNLDYSEWRNKTFADFEKQLGINVPQRTYGGKYLGPGGAPETPIDWSTFPKADYTDPFANALRNATWNQVSQHITPMQKAVTGNTPFDYRYPNEPITGVQVSRTQYTTPSPDMPSMRAGLPRTYSPTTGGIYGGQVSSQIQAEGEAIKKIDADIIKDNENISKTANKIAKDWKDIGGWIDKADKEQSVFWKNLESMGLYSMDKIVDKGVGDLFKKLFPEEDKRRAIDDWNDYGYQSGKSFKEFKTEWEKDQDRMKFTWKDFTKELVEDWAKMLIKMEAEAIARDIYGKITGSDTGGTSLTSAGVSKLFGGKSGVSSSSGGSGTSIATQLGITAGVGVGSYEIGKAINESDWGEKHPKASKFISALFGLGGALGGKSFDIFADGGVIDKPTFALMGEKGREYVFNEPQMQALKSGMRGGDVTVNVNLSFPNASIDTITEGQIQRVLVPAIRRAVQQGALS